MREGEMGAFRTAVTAVLLLTTAAIAEGQCVSEGRIISTRQSAPNLVAGPAAFGGGVLAVAKYERTARSIFLATYDHDFTQLSGDLLITTDTADGPLFLLWNGVDFGLIYRTESSERLMLQRISTDGDAIGGPIQVSNRRIRFREEVDALWSPALNAYVIASTFQPGAFIDVVVTVMERNGGIRRDIPINVFASQEQANLNVAVTDNGTIGVFYLNEREEVISAHLTPNSASAPVNTVWPNGRDLKVAAVGNNFYLVKTIVVGGKTEVRWLVLSSNGNVVAAERFLMRGSDLDMRPLSLTANNGELALTYLDAAVGFEFQPGEFRIHRFATDGSLRGDSLFIPPDNFVHRFAWSTFDPTWTGSAYVTTAVYEAGRELDSLLIRLCTLQATVVADRVIATVEDTIGFTAFAQGGVPGYTYRWDMGDRSTFRVGQSVRHRFIHPGTYDVVVTVTDTTGVATTATVRVQIVAFKRRSVRR
jgi:hypothetical protein